MPVYSLEIKSNGLKSDSIYTIWFVNMKPKKHETGAGSLPYILKTDSTGTGTYSDRLTEAPFGKWQMIMILITPKRGSEGYEKHGRSPLIKTLKTK